MKHKIQTEKTLTVTVGSDNIALSELPVELQNEFETFDKIKQDRMNALYKLEVLELAFLSKQQQLIKQLSDWSTAKKESSNE